jgi:transcriptional regulator with PAS, ATPase and Fis domain
MKQFEYLVKESYPEEFELNELGAQGWELIHITESRYIYKREKPHYEVKRRPPYEAKPNREDEVRVEEVPEGVRMEDEERKRIINALQTTNGDHKKAAELLGLSERTLHRKCKEYTIIFAKRK